MTTMNPQASSAYLAMPDAVNVNLLPVGYPAYLGYVDGRYQTASTLEAMFPDAELVLLTVRGVSVPGIHGVRVSPGTDVEPSDVAAAQAVGLVLRELAADPAARPVIYASVIGKPGYGMGDLLNLLTLNHVDRARVRLLSAHYGLGPHICGPSSCKAIGTEMDGTQWTNSYAVPGGVVDMSLLRPDFFGAPAPAPITETERLVQELGTVRRGDQGEAVKTVQGLCLARGYFVGGDNIDSIDGLFGPQTEAAVMRLQSHAKIPGDGIVGPLTWPVLLGVA